MDPAITVSTSSLHHLYIISCPSRSRRDRGLSREGPMDIKPLSWTYSVEMMGLEPTTPCLQSRLMGRMRVQLGARRHEMVSSSGRRRQAWAASRCSVDAEGLLTGPGQRKEFRSSRVGSACNHGHPDHVEISKQTTQTV